MGAMLKRPLATENNLEVSTLVWLDASVDTLQESLDAQQRLRLVIKHLQTFQRDDTCEEYIKSLPESDRITLIVSGSLGQKIVPHIHQQSQIISIYVYCGDRQKNEEWAKQFSKIRSVAVTLDELIGRIRSDQTQHQPNKGNEPLTFTTFKAATTKEQLTIGPNGQFVHSQLLIDCLLHIRSTSTDINELMSICREQYEGFDDQLDLIRKFPKEYSSNQAIRWYTSDSFVYRMLNQALRTQDIHFIFLFRFLIRDLEKKLKQNQCPSRLTVYRGQFMWHGELQNLKQSIGQLISINSFLSTSLDRASAYAFLRESNNLERVLFVIDADPHLHGIKPFANITQLSYYPKEAEVLFMLGAIFRLVDITHDRNGIWTIKLTLSSDNDHDLQETFNHLKSDDRQEGPDLIKLGDVLRRMGKYDDAQKYYRRCLKELLPDDNGNISACYYALGRLAADRGDGNQSLKYFHKSLEIYKQILKPNDPTIASTYNSIANIYQTNGDYQQALESYDKALTIFERALGEGHPHVAMCLNNIGTVYRQVKKYSEALNYYQKALNIRKKHLPRNHSDVGASHNNIGIVYRQLGQSDQALEQYNLALKIYEVSLPPEHPDIAMTLENIGIVYEEKHDWKAALSYYKKADVIYHQALSSTHPVVVQIEQNVQRMSLKLK